MRFLKKTIFTKSNWALGLYVENVFNVKHIDKPSLEIYDITDCKARGIADPFLIEHNEEIYVFFEIEKWINKKINKVKGVIGVAKLSNNKLHYLGTVLEENFHLSFPFILKYNNNIFMLPESSENKTLCLYKNISFPFKWEKHKVLLEGNFVDSILFFENDQWKLIVLEDNKFTNLYVASSLDEEFIFSKTLYINNKAIGRNGGYVKGFRVVQDCSIKYGEKIYFLEHNNSCEEYKTSFSPICGYRWDSTHIHHFNSVDFNGKVYHVYDAKGYQLRVKRLFKRLINEIRSNFF